jgi:hypothetical protein
VGWFPRGPEAFLPHIGASTCPPEDEDAMLYQLIDMIVRQVLTWVFTEIVRSLFAPPTPTGV